MSRILFIASAPGSLMLFGEHAVLHGHLAVVCAIAKRIRISLAPRTDTSIHIQSSLGKHVTDTKRIEIVPPFQFVLAAIRLQAGRLAHGFDMVIESEFSERIGFGSSAAVSVAATAALRALLSHPQDNNEIFRDSLHVVREIQGMGSGADVAASVNGGLLLYRAEPTEIEKLEHLYPITAVYSGSKTPTPEVVSIVEKKRRSSPTIYAEIFEAMDECAMGAADAAAMQDWKAFGQMMNTAHGLMDAMGVSNAKLSEIVYALRADAGILGSKISGSGLGDCAIGLGALQNKTLPYESWMLEMAREGVVVEETGRG